VTVDDTDTMPIILSRGDDDSLRNSPEFQRELAEFDVSLNAQGLDASPRLRFHDAVGGAGAYIGEFVLRLALGIGAVSARITPMLVDWIKNSNGRKV
jgi:hypothetical protein